MIELKNVENKKHRRYTSVNNFIIIFNKFEVIKNRFKKA